MRSCISGDEMVNQTLRSLCETPLLMLLRRLNGIYQRFPVFVLVHCWSFSPSACLEDVVLDVDRATYIILAMNLEYI